MIIDDRLREYKENHPTKKLNFGEISGSFFKREQDNSLPAGLYEISNDHDFAKGIEIKGGDWVFNYDLNQPVIEHYTSKSTGELKEIETQWRNSQLKSTDEFGLNDYPDNELRASMRAYRQELRDYPSIDGFGDESLRPIDPRN